MCQELTPDQRENLMDGLVSMAKAIAFFNAVGTSLLDESDALRDPDQWINHPEACEYLQVSDRTLRTHREQSKIRSKRFGRQWKYRKRWLDEYQKTVT